MSKQAKDMKSFLKTFLRDQRTILFMVLVVMSVGVAIAKPNFISTNNIILIFQQISIVGILTMAMSMLMLGGGVDLSVGNIMILSGCTMAALIHAENPLPLWAIVGICLVVGLLCGAANGFIVAKSKCAPLIITLGMSNIFYGLALIVTDARVQSFDRVFDGIRLMRIFKIIPITMLWFFALVIVTAVIINRTRFGRRIVAMGGNEENARLCGINVDLHKVLLYGISGLYCAIASIIFASRLDAITAAGGAGYETSSLTGAIIGGVTFDGGKGTISGAFLGALFMGVLSNAMNILTIDSYVQTVILGVAVVFSVVISNIDNIRKK